MDKRDRDRANVAAITEAQGWAALLGSDFFSGKSIDPKQFLPFPDEINEGSGSRISKKTARILQALEAENKLPPSLIADLGQFFEEALSLNV